MRTGKPDLATSWTQSKDGLTWTDTSGRNFVVTDLKEWVGERAQAGRLPPKGFPSRNKFG